ncbi:MAG: SDR family oxidoreductase, partial [Acidobacteriota bacterium]
MDVRGKNVLVTGGAKGIGLSLVRQLLAEGAVVGVFDLDREALDRLKAEHADVYVAACDVGDPDQVKIEVARFVEAHKRIHVLVNNAGFVFNSPLISLGKTGFVTHDIAMWDKVIRTDVSGVFYMTVNVVENMMATRTRGVVINISSIAAGGNAGQGAYSAAKAGVNALTVAWAKELGPMRIRFVAIAPGFVNTDTTVQSVETNILDGWVKETP